MSRLADERPGGDGVGRGGHVQPVGSEVCGEGLHIVDEHARQQW